MLSICFSGSVPPIRLELTGRERSSVSHNDVTRRVFLGSLAALGAGARIFTQSGGQTPIVPRALNHMTLSVTDIGRSLEFYQGLFGMPLAARQANTLVLRIGEGPQFVALSGGNANASRTMNHLCLTVDDFDADRLVGILGEHGVMPAAGRGLSGGPMRVRIRMRGEDFGGAAEGTPELYFGDPMGSSSSFKTRATAAGRVCSARCVTRLSRRRPLASSRFGSSTTSRFSCRIRHGRLRSIRRFLAC